MFEVARPLTFRTPSTGGKSDKAFEMPSYFLTTKKLHKKKPSVKGLCFMETCLVTAEDLTYLIVFKMKVKTHNVSVLDVVDIVMNVIAFTYRNETIVECIV